MDRHGAPPDMEPRPYSMNRYLYMDRYVKPITILCPYGRGQRVRLNAFGVEVLKRNASIIHGGKGKIESVDLYGSPYEQGSGTAWILLDGQDKPRIFSFGLFENE